MIGQSLYPGINIKHVCISHPGSHVKSLQMHTEMLSKASVILFTLADHSTHQTVIDYMSNIIFSIL